MGLRRFRGFMLEAVRSIRLLHIAGSRKAKAAAARTHQPFPFLSLPAELRLLVYDFLYGSNEVICDRQGLRRLLVISHINRLIRTEAVPFLYRTKTFAIEVPSLQPFSVEMPAIICANITSLQLEEFPNFVMQYLLGRAPNDHSGVPFTDDNSITTVFPALKRLSIRMSKQVDKRTQPTQAVLDRFLSEVTVELLLQQDSLQWLLRCRDLDNFQILRNRPSKAELTRMQAQPFGFLKTLVKALDELEEHVTNIVAQPIESSESQTPG